VSGQDGKGNHSASTPRRDSGSFGISLSPMIVAAAMSGSSLSVVGNAVRLRTAPLWVSGANIVGTVALLPIREYLSRFLESVEQLGVWGPVLVIVFYVVACLLFISFAVRW
jgi:hypothetical protein